MMKDNPVIETITSEDPAVRDRTAEELLAGRPATELVGWAGEVDRFLWRSKNLYGRVRAALFLWAIYRYFLPASGPARSEPLPVGAGRLLIARNWTGALRLLRPLLRDDPPEPARSAAAEAYYRLAFRLLREQVHESIARTEGNEKIFQLDQLDSYPLKVPEIYSVPDPESGEYPLGLDCCPVRIDPCHSGWSDIFFLAMDAPRAAKVVNISVDIARRGEGPPRPPIECFSRVIDHPVLRLVSLDLGAVREITSTDELFDFASSPLGLLQAGVVAAGLIPPAFREDDVALLKILSRLLGRGRGIELVTRVRHLPPGSRMAVSTTLLATIITRLMRLTGQIASPEGELTDSERRLVASRALLGEWLGGSGGGWQDAGGLWPGIKIITGVAARPGDPEHGISRGRLLPDYRVIPPEDLPPEIDRTLRESIVLVHGGLARDVGPVLELVTEKYLLRLEREWEARKRETGYFVRITAALRKGNMVELGRAVSEDWARGTKEIIPAAADAYTEELIARVRRQWGDKFFGFLMLGGQAGGGMAFIVDPSIHKECLGEMAGLMGEVMRRYRRALPFAMEPAVFDFSLNCVGIRGELRRGEKARLPEAYSRLLEAAPRSGPETGEESPPGFDAELHRHNRELYRRGEVSLARNRLPRGTMIEDASGGDIPDLPEAGSQDFRFCRALGEAALRAGEAAAVTLAGGLGSRWSPGGEVVKLLSPVVPLEGRYRSFLEIHLAKTARTALDYRRPFQHAVTTSPFTEEPIAGALDKSRRAGGPEAVYLSPAGALVGRLYPREDDLRDFFKTRIRAIRDRRKRRRERDRLDRLIRWADRRGPGEDFAEGSTRQRFHPPGHWYEIPNLIRNGTLGRMLEDNPALNYLLVHNADTLGASLDPLVLGVHIFSKKALSFEVIPRVWGDRGGFPARAGGRCRILEAGALPREEDEFLFTRYNSLTSWISLDQFLASLRLDREDIRRAGRDPEAGERVGKRLADLEKEIPVYLTLKEARFAAEGGRAETVPAAQCERLWGEMAGREGLETGFILVERRRGRQLKDPRTLDHAQRDGTIESLAPLVHFPANSG
jgi:hypothetical protein